MSVPCRYPFMDSTRAGFGKSSVILRDFSLERLRALRSHAEIIANAQKMHNGTPKAASTSNTTNISSTGPPHSQEVVKQRLSLNTRKARLGISPATRVPSGDLGSERSRNCQSNAQVPESSSVSSSTFLSDRPIRATWTTRVFILSLPQR